MNNAKKRKKEIVYGIFNQGKLIGYHEEKRVVKRYQKTVSNSKYQRRKISLKELEKIPDYQDLYLVRFGKSYLQVGYQPYVMDEYQTHLAELYLTKDVLLKLYELGNIEKKNQSALKKVLLILEEEIQDWETEVPSMEELHYLKQNKEEFLYRLYEDFEKDDYRWNH